MRKLGFDERWLEPPVPCDDVSDRERGRTMEEVREYVRRNKAAIDAEWDALEAPPLTIDQHIAHARKLRGLSVISDGEG